MNISLVVSLMLVRPHSSSYYCTVTPKGVGENYNAPFLHHWVLRWQFCSFAEKLLASLGRLSKDPKVNNYSTSNSVTEAIRRAVRNAFKVTFIGFLGTPNCTLLNYKISRMLKFFKNLHNEPRHLTPSV